MEQQAASNDIAMIVIEEEPGVSKEVSPIESNVNNISEALVIQETSALSMLAQYSGSESENDEQEENVYRKPVEVSSSSSCSSDSEDELDMKVIEKKIREPVVSDGDSDDENTNKKKKREPLKVKGELTIDDLPPIQDLQISIDLKECMEIGTVTTIVDQLVLVESFQNSVPLDIDSVLFLDHGKLALGKIFDVIGPVSMPIYCVRFNSHDDIVSKGISVGNKVYFAPRSEYSSYVIFPLVMSKGSDASWKNDVEPPENLVDYSDDEQERRTKRKVKANRSQNTGTQGIVRGQRHPNLAYPNHSWHQNLPMHMMNTEYSQNYQNYPQ